MPSTLYPEVNGRDHVDLDTRKAAIKAQLGQPLTPAELTRLANRQSIDEENARVMAQSPLYGGAAASNATAMTRATEAGAVGPRGIDVRSYTGSIYGPAGSAAPIPGYRAPGTFDQAADSILRTRFGAPPNERGQIDIVGAGGVRSAPSAAAMSVEAQPVPTVPDSARNVTPTLAAPPYAPAPGGSTLDTMLKGSRLDPGVRELGTQIDRAQLEATRVGTAATTAGLEDRAKSSAAARAAIAPGEDGAEPTADQILRNYIREGGRIDPSIITAAARPPRETPRLVDVGDGRKALTGSAQLVPDEKPPKVQTLKVGDKTVIVGPGNRYFDEQGNSIDLTPDEKPFTINEWLMMGKSPEEYETYRGSFAKMKGGPGAAAAQPAATKPAAGGPAQVTSKEEFDKLPKGAKFTFNDKTGIKK